MVKHASIQYPRDLTIGKAAVNEASKYQYVPDLHQSIIYMYYATYLSY